VIVTIGAMQTAAEARAACLAQGTPADACDEMIRLKTVNGVFCDGTVVTDASGKRCVPQSVVEQKLALTVIPPQPTSKNTKAAIAIGGSILAIGLVYLLVR
jgi:hypothetical protein